MPTGSYEPVAPDALPARLAGLLAAVEPAGVAVRVALDGPRAADPGALADALVEPLRALGRPTVRMRTETFWRDASLRFEHGREDVDAFRHEWLDAGALRREVLDPLRTGSYLPSLRDPATNRATRESPRTVRLGTVAIVSGELLLGRDLPFDVTVHLAMGAAARARRTPADWAWTLPAFDDYAGESTADIVVRYDDPRHPAISRLTPRASGTT